jgi:hypothetical protein
MFIPIDGPIQGEVSAILAAYERLVDSRKNRSRADPFVIALARLKGCAVVAEEGPTGRPDRPHIPDVCKGLSIRCIKLVEMFRELGWKFS